MRRNLWLQWLNGLLLMELTATEAFCSTYRQFAALTEHSHRLLLVGETAPAPRQTYLLALHANKIHEDELKQRVPQKTVPHSYRRTPQTRRITVSRRPKGYWQKVDNLECEIGDFWTNLGIGASETLCIPNEALLNYFGRHDLRAGIAIHGGRQELTLVLKNCVAMPGKWKQAVQTSPELMILLQNNTLGLSKDMTPLKNASPLSPLYQPQNQVRSETKWMHQPSRRPKGYWNQQTVIVELYRYLDEQHEKYRRPAVWMPRPSEPAIHGRDDLSLAIGRFGGAKRIAQIAGLVPFREWHFFEGQYELLVLLKEYIDKYHDLDGHSGDSSMKYQVFPSVSSMPSNGYERLHRLIHYFGGSRFLAARLGMKWRPHFDEGELWGHFSIEFAIRLSEFIRKEHQHAKPPIENPVISMPTESRLKRAGPEGAWLHDRISLFGGYENVARRLYLGYSFKQPAR